MEFMVESQIMNKNGSLLTCQWNIILRMRQDWFAFFFFLNWAKIYIQWKVQMLSKEIDEFLQITSLDNQHPSQDTEHFHHPRKLLQALFQPVPILHK